MFAWADEEYVLDVEELTPDGDAFVFRATQFDGTKRLDARKLILPAVTS